MKRILKAAIVSLCLVGIISITLHVSAAEMVHAMSTPLKGHGTGQIVSAIPGPSGFATISATGVGVATHLGRFEREEQLILNLTTFSFTGTIVFTAADGDQLWISVVGQFTSPTTAEGTYTVTGGTGRFENASGSADFSVTQSDPVNFSFAFLGTLESN